MNKELISFDGINVIVVRKKIKNINLRINRDKVVTVSASSRISINKIEEFVKSKKNWIINNVNKIESYNKNNVKNYEYIDGEKIRIQNSDYIFKVIECNKNKVEIENDNIVLYTTDILNYKKKKSIMDKFLNNLAQELFNDTLNYMLELIKPFGVNKPNMKIRKMKSRWGSCIKAKNQITINFELVKLSKGCLEYVVLHELIHFLVSGHNKNFYGYFSMLMPDWKIRKKILNEAHL